MINININIGDMTPRYLQIIQYYLQKIQNGEIGVGEKLPTETEICSFFNVSRITARQALDGLAKAGYIVKKQGKGSYVNLNKMNMQLNSFQGFSEEMRSKGFVPGSKIISVEICSPDEYVAAKLSIDTSVKVYLVKRIRYANDIALSLENVYLPFYLCPDIDQYDLNGSLYELLKNKYNFIFKKATQCIEAGLIDKPTAQLLNVKTGTSALIIERVSFLTNDTPFEFVKSVYRGDKYKFNVDLYCDKNY